MMKKYARLLLKTRSVFLAISVWSLGLISSATAGIIVSENYSTGAGFTPGFVQSTYSAMPGSYGGTTITGTDDVLYQVFTPDSDYDLVSLEFRYNIDSMGSSPNVNFNLYNIPTLPATPADNLVLGSAILGSGIDYTPTELASAASTNMVVTFTDSDVISLTSGNSYAVAVSSTDMVWQMFRKGSGNAAGGYGYNDLAPLNSAGRDFLVSFYDTAVIPEPSSLLLLVAGFAVLGVMRKRR